MKNKLFLGAIVGIASTSLGATKKEITIEGKKHNCTCTLVEEKTKPKKNITKKSDRLEDNVISVNDVSFELHKNSRYTLKKMLKKYGEKANFSFPVKMAQVDYHYKGDTKSSFDAIVYVTPQMAKKILNDASVNKVIVNGWQKKHKDRATFIVKDIKPTFVANLEPEDDWLLSEKHDKPKNVASKSKKKNVSKPKATGVMKNKDEIDIEKIIKKTISKWS